MFACPTEALVMFPEGGLPPPLKVPEIDDNFQTAVPGQYLIGEVAGKPLVKSAANLGRAVIEHMMTMGLRPGALGRGGGVAADRSAPAQATTTSAIARSSTGARSWERATKPIVAACASAAPAALAQAA